MKKKFLILTLALVMSLALTGCHHKESSQENKTAKKLSDWILSGKGVVCTVNTLQGEITTKTKGDKARMDGIMYVDMLSSDASQGSQTGSSISDGDWFYMWGETTGVKMNIKEMERLGNDAGDDYGVKEENYSVETWVKNMEDAGVSYNCQEKNISDNEFEVPSDIKFTNLTEMLKKMQNLGQDVLNGGVGKMDGSELPKIQGSNNMTQEEIEAQLEKLMGN